MMIDVIANYGDLCGECPVWDETTSTLYWVDAVGRRFYRYEARTRRHQIVSEGVEIYGFRRNQKGGFVITNPSGIWFWSAGGTPRLLAEEVYGVKCQMNDCTADSHGRLYAGTTYFDTAVTYKLGHLLRVDNNGAVAILDEGFHLSNGIAFSTDERTMYFTDSVGRRIYAYDYDAATGDVRNRRVLIEVPREEGIPDGLTVDAEGFLWSAQWYGSSVVRYDPDGRVERRIQTPAKQTSSCAFGGAQLDELYITSAARSEPTTEIPVGYDPETGYFGGALYMTRPGVRGRAMPMADILL
jgi:sugar lactone lactonase YvrE